MKNKKMLILICSAVLMVGAFTACSPSKEKSTEATPSDKVETLTPGLEGENEEQPAPEGDISNTVGTMMPASEGKKE